MLHALEVDADPRVWGSKTEQADVWTAHDAVSLAAALEGLPLYVSYGNGEYGPLDETEKQEQADIEAWLFPQNEAFVARLEELDIPATVNVGPGTHTWPYWERGLARGDADAARGARSLKERIPLHDLRLLNPVLVMWRHAPEWEALRRGRCIRGVRGGSSGVRSIRWSGRGPASATGIVRASGGPGGEHDSAIVTSDG